MFNEMTGKLLERMEKLFVAAVSDVLDSMGFLNQTMHSGFKPLIPEAKVAGPAITLRVTKMTERGPPKDIEEIIDIFAPFFDSLRPDHVAVVDTNNCHEFAAYGELMSSISISKGVKGAVVDGAIRDISRVLRLRFPIWYKGNIPTDSIPRFEIVGVNRPIWCGGVRVKPGDIIFADADGVVVVPKELDLEKVVEKAERKVELEEKTREELLAGKPYREVLRKYKVL